MSLFRRPKYALITILLVAVCAAPAVFAGPSLDIRPSVCPNLLTRNFNAPLGVALVSDVDFIVAEAGVDPASLLLSRADGIGGSAMPLSVRAAAVIMDVASPTPSGMCPVQAGDGLRDLRMLFGQSDVVDQLELDAVPLHSSIELCLSGDSDGGPFEACDFVVVTELYLFPADLDDLPSLSPRER